MRVLITDKIDDSFLFLLEENKIEFDYKPEITHQNLLSSMSFYDGLIVRSRTKVAREIISSGTNLKVIGRVGSGVDNIDISTCRKRRIMVTNAPDANSQAVAEHTVGLMLSLLRNYQKAFFSMKEGLWIKKQLRGKELAGKIVGIVGYGRIGKKIAKVVSSFGANVLIYSRSYQTTTFREIFGKSDIVTLHLPLTDKTKGCVSKDLLRLMRPTSFLVNTSRGEVIDQKALLQVLQDKKIAGAALDVFWQEPLPVDSPFRKLDNVVLTPHIGASTKEALKKASEIVIKDVIRVLKT